MRQALGIHNPHFPLRKKDKGTAKQLEEKLERDIRYDLGNAFIGFFIDLLGNYKDFNKPAKAGTLFEPISSPTYNTS